MIFFGNSTKAIIIWAVVVLVITGGTLLVVTQVVNDTTEDVNSSIDRAFDQSEEIQEEAIEDAEELSESIQENVDEATGGTAAGSGGGKGESTGGANAQIEQANRLLSCISEADGDVDVIQACNATFGP